jgi:hypothetical protein
MASRAKDDHPVDIGRLLDGLSEEGRHLLTEEVLRRLNEHIEERGRDYLGAVNAARAAMVKELEQGGMTVGELAYCVGQLAGGFAARLELVGDNGRYFSDVVIAITKMGLMPHSVEMARQDAAKTRREKETGDVGRGNDAR